MVRPGRFTGPLYYTVVSVPFDLLVKLRYIQDIHKPSRS